MKRLRLISENNRIFEERTRCRFQSTRYIAKERMLLTEAYSRSFNALASRWDPVDVVVVGGSPFLYVSVKRDRY
ncbi:hypothetical protein ACS0PU_010118 [Formica fusca]